VNIDAHRMTSLRKLVSFGILSLALGCSSGGKTNNRPGDTGGEGGDDTGGKPATGGKSGTGGNKGTGGSGTGGATGGATGGSGMPDASVDADNGGGSVDASPDAYVRTMGGPFGLDKRPGPQTCKVANPDMPPAKLSATGCADPTDIKKPAASLIPYDVNSPLWSDGASKTRFMAVPDGAVIHVKDCMREPDTCGMNGTTDDDGHWILPVGTVLVKHFLFNGKFHETRLYVRFADKWAGYSYEWNAAQTEANLVDAAGVTKMIMGATGMQAWYYPAREDCNVCHNETVGFTLGPETRQMNRMLTYTGGAANQIATLEHLGLFDAPVRTMGLDPLPTPTTTGTAQTLEGRARSYIHANCAICHRPGGEYPAIDLRWGTALKDANICNVDPNKGDVGVPTSKRLTPGMPGQSVMYLRMNTLDKLARMPQLATSVIDPLGTKLVSDWITATKTCP
jgi:uncharacterized repeat protein (TIGR03806 family)